MPVTVDVDTAARSLTATWERLFELFETPWFERRGGVVGWVSGVPIPIFNGVWAESTTPDAAVVAQFLDRISDSGLPYCVQLRPGPPEDITAELAQRNLVLWGETPLMVLENTGRLEKAQTVEGLELRRLRPDEISTHLRIVANAFQLDKTALAQFMTPEKMDRRELRCYVGEHGGEAVTTGLGIRLHDFIGVFDIATDADRRRRGFGAAVTARIVTDAMADGARWAWLQSSSAGYGVYKALGFEARERWGCWVAPAAEPAG